jgi:hypothetical protein
MNIKAKFQNLISWIIGILFLSAAVFLLVMFVKGMNWVAEVILPLLNIALAYAGGVCIFILLPLALIKKARLISVIGLGITFQLSLVYLWLTSMVVTYSIWGTIGVVIGLFMGGVGVIPLAFLASMLNGAWPVTGALAYNLGCTLALLAVTAWIGSKVED